MDLGKSDSKGVVLTWKPFDKVVETKGFRVYRASDEKTPLVELTTDILPARGEDGKIPAMFSYTDSTTEAGKTYTYYVTAEEWSTLESDKTSNGLKVAVSTSGSKATPVAAIEKFDTTAPQPVGSFEAARETDEAGQYRLKWTPTPDHDVRYYNVYFSSKGQPAIEQKRLIVSPLPSMSQSLDWTAPEGGDAYYAITAVDRQGNESTPVFAKAN